MIEAKSPPLPRASEPLSIYLYELTIGTFSGACLIQIHNYSVPLNMQYDIVYYNNVQMFKPMMSSVYCIPHYHHLYCCEGFQNVWKTLMLPLLVLLDYHYSNIYHRVFFFLLFVLFIMFINIMFFLVFCDRETGNDSFINIISKIGVLDVVYFWKQEVKRC